MKHSYADVEVISFDTWEISSYLDPEGSKVIGILMLLHADVKELNSQEEISNIVFEFTYNMIVFYHVDLM